MTGTENLNFKVSAMGDTKREPCNFNILTLEKICRWIDKQPTLEDGVKEELKNKAGKYPQTALQNFKDNFKLHVAKAKKNVREVTPLNQEDNFNDNICDP